jgi:CheY-like chemotaxis protein
MTDGAGPAPAATGSEPVVTSIGEVRPQVRADVSGVIRTVRAMSIGGSPACSYTLADRTGRLDLLFLGRVQVAGLEKGRHCRAEGMVAIRDDRNVIWNPKYWIQPDEQDAQGRAARSAGGEEPLSWAAAPTRPGAGRPTRSPAGRRVSRVLVVDDDKAIRRVLAMSLKAHGYQVDLAGTGEEAVALAGRDPDLILLDVGLPDINGLMVVSELQAECDAPIIVISARETTATRPAALAAGAVDYLQKPFSVDGLLARIRLITPPQASPPLAGIGVPDRR